MKKRKIFDKAVKLFAVIMLVLSMCFLQKYTNNVEAWDNSTPHEFTRIKEINYPWWWSSKIGSTKRWSTYMCKYDDKYAYCLESSKKSPAIGKYPAQVIENNEAVRKILYYGFGGPGYNQASKEMYAAELKACVPDDFGDSHGNFDDGAYLFTHIWLSYAYAGDLMGLNLKDFNSKWPNSDGNGGYGDNILWGYHWIMDQPDIGYAYFNPSQDGGMTASFKAEFDKENKLQKTNVVKLEGTNHATINVPLQDNVTLHNVTKGTKQTGGIANVNGGESFYLTAPIKNSPKNYKSGNIAGKGCEMFTALAIKDGADGTQTEGSWNLDPDGNVLKYEVDWLDFGALRLSKVDNTSQFQKNSKFRLISTSYSGYDETFEVTKDENGDYELFIDYLPVGTYSLTEVECDDHYAPAVAKWQVTIVKNQTTKKIVVNTLRPTGTLKLQKKLEDASQGAINLADKDITKTKYQIIATDDIIDTVSLKKLYSKGEKIILGSGKCIIDTNDGQSMIYSNGIAVSKGVMDEEGIISVDENGQFEVTGIPLGKYQVEEVECPSGYVLDTTPYEFSITQKDYTTTIYTKSHEQTNKITKTTFTKTDVTGDQEVIGAKMSVVNEEGTLIDEWISSDKAHEIDGLESGKTYYLNEDTSPAGYVKASRIEFKVNEDGKIQKVNMKDKVVTISKTTLCGEEIAGALLQVIDENGNILEQWYSDGKVHYVSGLEEGKTYTLHEDLAPLGFTLTNDISFMVSYEKENQKVEMVDSMVKVYKQKEDGSLLKGAQLTVASTKTKNRVDQWITGQHLIDIDDEMKKKMLKREICEGENNKGEEYRIISQLKSNDYFLMLKDNDDVVYYCIDVQGNETAHLVQGLNSGERYILRETLTPKGYATFKEQLFTVDENDVVLKAVDEDIKVDISKKDITDKKELPGAHLQVKDEKGEIVDSWISTSQEHRISHLEVGKKYILEETLAPNGYEKSERVEFVIKNTGQVQKVIMYDQPIIQVVKTGDYTNMDGYLVLGVLSGICLYLCKKRDNIRSPK